MITVWRPQPKQLAFMRRPEYECLYGGAAGGGKSDALLCEALRQVHIPHYRGLILRKTYPQLAELIDRSRELYGKAFPTAKYNGTEHCWTFQSGAKIYFGSMQYTKDRVNYQGKRYDYIAFDELTHFQWEEYSYMFSRNRPSGPGTRCYIRAATNPGGIGHGWVKERFITAAPPMTPIETSMDVIGPDGKKMNVSRKRIFVPSTVFDNQALLDNNPEYIASLSMMPEAERNALLYGSWDSFDGQVFREWRNDPAHYDDQRWTHVVQPFRIPGHWRIFRGFDFGYAKPFSVGWYAADEDGRLYRIAEYYGCTGTPNTGIRINPVEIAAESVAAMMERPPNLVYWTGGDNTRLAGKMQFHYRLAFDGDGRPMFQVFDTCKHFIRTIPNLVYDDKHVEDIDTDQEDHIYDECRYVLMENPISPRKNALQKPPADDPLDLYAKDTNKYKFYRM